MAVGSASRPGPDIILDLASVETLSAAMLGKLVRLRRLLKASGQELGFCNVPDDVLEILQITGLTRVFAIHAPSGEIGQVRDAPLWLRGRGNGRIREG